MRSAEGTQRILAFGPVRYRRQVLSVFYPMALVIPTAILGHLSLSGLALALLVASALAPRARAMKIECRDEVLHIRNMFTSHAFPLTDIAEVGWSRALAPGHTVILELTTTNGRIYPAAGVSVWSDAFRLRRQFTTKNALAAIDRVRT
ncbi:MAG: hypothetical protein LC749_02555, partial [Actinobacteria bacterium]|nr:hypothetical protein [Actinomycetota bacterium]